MHRAGKNPLILVLLLLAAGLDAWACLLAFTAEPPTREVGFLLHLVLSLAVAAGVSRQISIRPRKGHRTVGFLIAMVSLLTPVLGILATAFWVICVDRKAATESWRSRYVIGNPLRQRSTVPPRPYPTLLESNESSIEMLTGEQQRWAIGLMRMSHTRKSLLLLRHMVNTASPRTQLFAQAALSSMSEAIEASISRLQRAVSLRPDASGERERLAQALWQKAASGALTPFEQRESLEEADRHWSILAKTKPKDEAILHAWAKCLLQLRRFTELDQLLNRLRELNPRDVRIQYLEARKHALQGNWAEVALAVDTSDQGTAKSPFSDASLKFWHSGRLSAPQ